MKSLFRYALIFVFLAALSLPALQMIFSFQKPLVQEIQEKRKRVRMDHLLSGDLWTAPERIDEYFDQHIGFRDFLIRLARSVRWDVLQQQQSERVVRGKEGWLFNGREKVLRLVQHTVVYSDEELKSFALRYERRRRVLEKQGIQYRLLFAPAKSAIYAEYFPDHLRKLPRKNIWQRFTRQLKKYSKVQLVDPTEALLAAKAKGRTFFKGDVHWNDYGAYVAYRELLQSLSAWRSIDPIPLAAYRKMNRCYAGNFVRFLSRFSEPCWNSTFYRFRGGDRALSKAFKERSVRLAPLIVDRRLEDREHELQRAVVLHDSFFRRLRKYFTRHVEYTFLRRYRRKFLSNEEILSLKPDLVIDEFSAYRFPGNLDLNDDRKVKVLG